MTGGSPTKASKRKLPSWLDDSTPSNSKKSTLRRTQSHSILPAPTVPSPPNATLVAPVVLKRSKSHSNLPIPSVASPTSSTTKRSKADTPLLVASSTSSIGSNNSNNRIATRASSRHTPPTSPSSTTPPGRPIVRSTSLPNTPSTTTTPPDIKKRSVTFSTPPATYVAPSSTPPRPPTPFPNKSPASPTSAPTTPPLGANTTPPKSSMKHSTSLPVMPAHQPLREKQASHSTSMHIPPAPPLSALKTSPNSKYSLSRQSSMITSPSSDKLTYGGATPTTSPTSKSNITSPTSDECRLVSRRGVPQNAPETVTPTTSPGPKSSSPTTSPLNKSLSTSKLSFESPNKSTSPKATTYTTTIVSVTTDTTTATDGIIAITNSNINVNNSINKVATNTIVHTTSSIDRGSPLHSPQLSPLSSPTSADDVMVSLSPVDDVILPHQQASSHNNRADDIISNSSQLIFTSPSSTPSDGEYTSDDVISTAPKQSAYEINTTEYTSPSSITPSDDEYTNNESKKEGNDEYRDSSDDEFNISDEDDGDNDYFVEFSSQSTLASPVLSPSEEDVSAEGDDVSNNNKLGSYACELPCSQRPVIRNMNKEITSALEDLMKQHSYRGEQWQALALKKAINTLTSHPVRIKTLKDAKGIKGIGNRILAKIEAILHGFPLTQATPAAPQLGLFSGIWGAGPKSVMAWVNKGYVNLEDLSTDHDLSPQQRIGIKHYHDFLVRIPRSEVEEHVKIVEKQARSLLKGDCVDIIAAGSYRRGKADCGDIDVVICHAHKKPVGVLHELIDRLHKLDFLTDDLQLSKIDDRKDWAHHHDKYLGVSRLSPNHLHRRIDILMVPNGSYAATVMYLTGSQYFNRSMRARAKKIGFYLCNHALARANAFGKRNSEPIPVNSEHEIFSLLGLEYRSPEERDW